MTARWALYMSAMKVFETHWLCLWTLFPHCSAKKTAWSRCSLWSWCSSCQRSCRVLRLQRLHTTRLHVEATSGASTTLVFTSSLQGQWHVGHWYSDTGTGPTFVESSCYGLWVRHTTMMIMMTFVLIWMCIENVKCVALAIPKIIAIGDLVGVVNPNLGE